MPASSTVLSPQQQLDSPEAGRVALKFFFNLMERWGCTAEQQRTLWAKSVIRLSTNTNTCHPTCACPTTPSASRI